MVLRKFEYLGAHLHIVFKCCFYRYKAMRSFLEEWFSNLSHSPFLDKRSRHLGADGVYLDDLTDMDPEVAALYFPKK